MAEKAIEGMDELARGFMTLSQQTGVKVTRQAAVDSTKPFRAKLAAAAPVGKMSHRTYKGRLVRPGLTSRSIGYKARVKNGIVYVDIGVKVEAFYSIVFIDQGPHQVRSRKINGIEKAVKPYRIPHKQWFEKNFENGERGMVNRFGDSLRLKLSAALRRRSSPGKRVR